MIIKNSLKKRSSELLELIPEQNKQELGRYIIRREMVTKILELILSNSLTEQNIEKGKGERTDKEGLIHDLIFLRKSQQNASLNDLWVLNEEFMHFDGCSEIPLNQIQNSRGEKLLKDFNNEAEIRAKFGIRDIRRPDIFLFAEEGKCVLIEFKSADTDLSNHLNQLVRYANLIANSSTTKIDQFFCYLISEKIDRVDLPSGFDKSVLGDFVRPYLAIKSVEEGKEDFVIASIHQEIIKLSSLHNRASIRNKSFADKLGIRIDNSLTESESKIP